MQGGRAAGPSLSDLCRNPAWDLGCPICGVTRLGGSLYGAELSRRPTLLGQTIE